MIVLPGFVDTHRHTWQSALRAATPDMTLPDYVELILHGYGPRYRPEDVHRGNLCGALDALGSGVTTLLDWSHIQRSPETTEAAIAGLAESGIRGVFGYCYGGDGGPSDLAAAARWAHDRLPGGMSMVIAAKGPEFVEAERARAEWAIARELGVPVSAHLGGHGAESARRGLEFLSSEGLLGDGTTFVHPNFYDDEALKRIAGSGGTASLAPISEAALGIGYPATGRLLQAGIPVSLSADSVAAGPVNMFEVMRAAYMLERARPGGAGLDFTTRDALRLATMGGAEVLGLAGSIGSLQPGKQADLLLVRAEPTVADPVATLVLAAGPEHVDTVLVGGRIVKRAGALPHAPVTGLAGTVDYLLQSNSSRSSAGSQR
jgi:cytosine/adenosine deaminase-related metal-dependent hydrolase